MKLLRLHVSGYKNLEDIEIDFSKSDRSALIIGTNGSGKSNLLEVFSAIFSAMYEKKNNVTPDFLFELEYLIERMRTGSFAGGPLYDFPVWVRLRNVDGKIGMEIHDSINTEWGLVTKKDYNKFLPDHVVAIYSGEEKRLWEEYYEHAYIDYNKQYRKNVPYTPQHLLYINKYYWDLIASMLTIYEDDACKTFSRDLGLNITGIHCVFDTKNMVDNKNAMATEMLNIINPGRQKEVDLTIDQLKRLGEACGYESDIFYNLIVLVLYKQFKIITEYKIICDDGRTIRDLSEGEKKLLLIYGAQYIVNGENLFLLDEPDAHIHEGRKRDIFEQISSSAENQFVITSHSPTMTTLFKDNNIFMLGGKNHTVLENNSKALAIKELTNNEWSYNEVISLVNSPRSMLLCEGKTDIEYVKKSIALLKEDFPEYKKLDFDMLCFGGTGNAKEFLDNLRNIVGNEKKIICVFDRDEAGAKAAKKINNDSDLSHTNFDSEWIDNTCILMLPKRDGVTGSEFVIEDYFDQSLLKGVITQIMNNWRTQSSLCIPDDLRKKIKKKIESNCNNYDKNDFEGFKVLLDKLLETIS